MALSKVTYVDGVTVIGAANLNAIQDEVIANADKVVPTGGSKRQVLTKETSGYNWQTPAVITDDDIPVTPTITPESEIIAFGSYNKDSETGTIAFFYDWDGNVEVQGNLTAANIPAPPSSNGTYSLKCTVSGGTVTYSWA